MTWNETFDRIAAHYTAMAMTPGWWQYAQARVAELERYEIWVGLRSEVGGRVKAAGYRPSANDLAAFERTPDPWPGSRRWPGR